MARRYRFADGSGEVGFISSVSQPFCGSCTRLRLSADGKLYTCLFSQKFTDVGRMMRDGIDDAELREVLRGVWSARNDRYSEIRHRPQKNVSLPKVEMFHVGG